MKSLQKGVIGGKVCANHSTVIAEAQQLILAIKPDPVITKIALGHIARGTGVPRLKFTSTATGLRLTVRGHNAVQIFYITTTNRHVAAIVIRQAWRNIYPNAPQ